MMGSQRGRILLLSWKLLGPSATKELPLVVLIGIYQSKSKWETSQVMMFPEVDEIPHVLSHRISTVTKILV